MMYGTLRSLPLDLRVHYALFNVPMVDYVVHIETPLFVHFNVSIRAWYNTESTRLYKRVTKHHVHQLNQTFNPSITCCYHALNKQLCSDAGRGCARCFSGRPRVIFLTYSAANSAACLNELLYAPVLIRAIRKVPPYCEGDLLLSELLLRNL